MSELSFKPIQTISEQAKSLSVYMQDREMVTYDELDKVAGESVRTSRGRGWLKTVRRVLQRERNQVWLPVRGVGLKRGNVDEVRDAANHQVTKSRRSSWRGIKQIATVDFRTLNNDQRVRFNTTASLLGAIHHMTGSRSVAKIEAAVAVVQDKLPLEKTLAAFGVVSEKEQSN